MVPATAASMVFLSELSMAIGLEIERETALASQLASESDGVMEPRLDCE